MRKALFSILFCLSYVVIWAQYEIRYEDNVLNPKEKAALEQMIDFQLKFYNGIYPDSLIRASDVRLNIYTDYAAYLLYQKEQMGSTLHNSMGFYSSKNKEAVVCKDKREKEFLKICYHELSHFFTNTYFHSIPIWVNEGLSEYFENMKIGKTVKHEKNQRHISRVETMIDTRNIDLKDFMLWDRKKFYSMSFAHDSYGYALGYSIVLFLMEKDQDMLIEYIRHIAKNKNPLEEMESLYLGGVDQFETDFLKYISR